MGQTNTVNLKAIVEVAVKLDNASLNSLKKQLSSGLAGISIGGATVNAKAGASGGSSGGGGGGGMSAPKPTSSGSGLGAGIVEGTAIGMGIEIMEKIFGLLQQMLEIMQQASPLFNAVGKLFMTTMKLIFMPLGNMIARLLMPIALKYMVASAKMATTWANSPPSDINTVAQGTFNMMIELLVNVLGIILTKVFIPLFQALAKAIVIGLLKGLTMILSGGKIQIFDDAIMAFNDDVSFFQDQLSAASLGAYSFSTQVDLAGAMIGVSGVGLTNALDQFGMTVYTTNNTMGQVASDLATTFYISNQTIEDGFNYSAQVISIGTDRMLSYMYDHYNLMAAGIVSTVNTQTEAVYTFGQNIDALSSTYGAAVIQAIDWMNQPIKDIANDFYMIGNGLNDAATLLATAMEAIQIALRNWTLYVEGVNPDDPRPDGSTNTTSKKIDWWKMGIDTLATAIQMSPPGFMINKLLNYKDPSYGLLTPLNNLFKNASEGKYTKTETTTTSSSSSTPKATFGNAIDRYEARSATNQLSNDKIIKFNNIAAGGGGDKTTGNEVTMWDILNRNGDLDGLTSQLKMASTNSQQRWNTFNKQMEDFTLGCENGTCGIITKVDTSGLMDKATYAPLTYTSNGAILNSEVSNYSAGMQKSVNSAVKGSGATINVTIQGNVYGVDELRNYIKQVWDEYSYSLKGGY